MGAGVLGRAEIRIKKKFLVLITLGIMAVAFLGVIAGNQFIFWRQGKASRHSEALYDRDKVGLLETGELFPNVKLMDLTGKETSARELLLGKVTIITFLSLGCEPCSDLMSSWKLYSDKLPDYMQIIGICGNDIESARSYLQQTGWPFSVYCDTADLFISEYQIYSYPSFVGLTKEGVITYLHHGYSEQSDPISIFEFINSEE